MPHFMKIFLVIVVMASLGCAGTAKYNEALTQYQISPNRATIKVKRECAVRGSNLSIYIQDGTTKIGEMGSCGEIAWGHEPGYVAIISGSPAENLTHVLIFPVEAGKTYSLVARLGFGLDVHCEPVNFAQELIAYEEISKPDFWGRAHLSDQWKFELWKLQEGQH